jgi:hypothetical protein
MLEIRRADDIAPAFETLKVYGQGKTECLTGHIVLDSNSFRRVRRRLLDWNKSRSGSR